MDPQLQTISEKALEELERIQDRPGLDAWRQLYLGRKGVLAEQLRRVGQLAPAARPAYGREVHALQDRLESAWEAREVLLRRKELAAQARQECVDITLPGRQRRLGAYHPITQVLREMIETFYALGFQVWDGPEVELDRYNFELLNMPAHHPARAMHDTFYLDTPELRAGPSGAPAPGALLLRTHTSPNQIRIMPQVGLPLRVVVPGRVYRYEQVDPSHNWMFYQVEGFVVDRGITLADLKGTITAVLRRVFGRQVRLRFRCDYFPYVEPGVDTAVGCVLCQGAGCRLCGGTGWLEVMPAGMIHPQVLRNCGIDPDRYSGFAFGAGPDRIAAIRWQIEDIRHLYQNDLRFLQQFRAALQRPRAKEGAA
ncbi:MAG: phenylalanine--tRNA ligase subunit alpha [Chloroflexia bacterium]|nr:phenylalanine--tRNA ligase subunit alpha [Chloroflexia bacterium]